MLISSLRFALLSSVFQKGGLLRLWRSEITRTFLVIALAGAVVVAAGLYFGGLKIDRLIVLLKSLRNKIARTDSPNMVNTLTVDGRSISNVGPGMGNVGSMSNYSFMPGLAKWNSVVLMLLGRLEIFPFLTAIRILVK